MKLFYSTLICILFSLPSFGQFLTETVFQGGISSIGEKIIFDTVSQSFFVATIHQRQGDNINTDLIIHQIDTNANKISSSSFPSGAFEVIEFGRYSDTSFYLVIDIIHSCIFYKEYEFFEYIPSTSTLNKVTNDFHYYGYLSFNGFPNGERLEIKPMSGGGGLEQVLIRGDSTIVWNHSYSAMRGVIREGVNHSIAIGGLGTLSVLERTTGQILHQKTNHSVIDFLSYNNEYYIVHSNNGEPYVQRMDSSLNVIQSVLLPMNSWAKTIKKTPYGVDIFNDNEIIQLDNNLNIIEINSSPYSSFFYKDIAHYGDKTYILGYNSPSNAGDYPFSGPVRYAILLEKKDNSSSIDYEMLDISLDTITIDTFIKGTQHRTIGHHFTGYNTYWDAHFNDVSFTVTNHSTVSINEFYIQTRNTDGDIDRCLYSGFFHHVDQVNIAPGSSITVNVPSIYLKFNATSSPCFKITAPNGKMDKYPSNNDACAARNVNTIIDNSTIDTLAIINESSFSIYPNPAVQTLHVELKEDKILAEDAMIFIYNSVGQLVHNEMLAAATNKVEININGLRRGIYYLKIQDSTNEFITYKFIKLK